MAEHQKEGWLSEHKLRWARNVSLLAALGTAAASAALPQYRPELLFAAGVNVAQALGLEALRLRKINKPATAQ